MAYNSISKEGYAVQETTAILSNELLDDHQYTVFAFGGVVLRFRAPDCLQAYTAVKEWDNGYLVVMAKYSHKEQPIEEYIDLLPILENLRMDAQGFLTPIHSVAIARDLPEWLDFASISASTLAEMDCAVADCKAGTFSSSIDLSDFD